MSLDKLPDEIILIITSPQYLSNVELKRLRRTSSRLASVLCTPLFRTIRLDITPTRYDPEHAKPFTTDDKWRSAPEFSVIRDQARILEVRATNFNASDEFRWCIDHTHSASQWHQKCFCKTTDTELDKLVDFLPKLVEVRLKVSVTVLQRSQSEFMKWLGTARNIKVYVTILCGGQDLGYDPPERRSIVKVPNLPMAGPNVRGLCIEKTSERVNVHSASAVVHALRRCGYLEQLSLSFEIREFEDEEGGYIPISKYLPVFGFIMQMPPCITRITRLSMRGMVDHDWNFWPYAGKNPIVSNFWEVVIPSMSDHLKALIIVPEEYNGFCFTPDGASYNAIKMCKKLENLCVVPIDKEANVYLTELLEWAYSHKNLSRLQIGCTQSNDRYPTKGREKRRKELVDQLRHFVREKQGTMGGGGVFEVVVPESVRIRKRRGTCGGDTHVIWRWTRVAKRGRLRLKDEDVWCFKREEDQEVEKSGLERLLNGMSRDWDGRSVGLVQRATRKIVPGVLEGSVKSSRSWRLQYSHRLNKVVFEAR